MLTVVSFSESSGALVGEYARHSITTPDGLVYEGRLKNGFTRNQAVGFWPWGTTGTLESARIVLDNTDGFFDKYTAWDLRDGNITIAQLVNNIPTVSERLEIDEIELNARELIITASATLALLDKPSQHITIDGVPLSSANGLSVPRAIGTCFSAPPVLIDDVNNVYIVSEDVPKTFGTLEDRLDPLVLNTDYTRINSEPITGAAGYDLNSPADGTITVKNLVGQAFDPAGSNINSKLMGGFYRRLLLEIAGIPANKIDFTELDAIAALPRNSGLRFGAWIDSPQNLLDIFNKSLEPWFGFVWYDNQGVLHFGQIDDTGTPTITVEDWQITDQPVLRHDGAPGLTDGYAFGKNWHVFSYDEVRDIIGISEDDKRKRTREYQIIQRTTGGSFPWAYRHADGACAKGFPYLTSGYDAAGGNWEWLKNAYSNPRSLITFSAIVDDVKLGDRLTLQYERYQFPQTGTVVELADKLDGEKTITIWV